MSAGCAAAALLSFSSTSTCRCAAVPHRAAQQREELHLRSSVPDTVYRRLADAGADPDDHAKTLKMTLTATFCIEGRCPMDIDKFLRAFEAAPGGMSPGEEEGVQLAAVQNNPTPPTGMRASDGREVQLPNMQARFGTGESAGGRGW
eukprot:3302077-Rhodomonas_salina.3